MAVKLLGDQPSVATLNPEITYQTPGWRSEIGRSKVAYWKCAILNQDLGKSNLVF